MGDCYIVRRGGSSGPAYSLPVLNDAYPQDVTVVASANGSASFTVQITQPGTPAEYTYQWYKDGSAIASATGASVTLTGLTEAASHTVYCVVTNKAGAVTSRVATLTVKDWKPAYTYTGSSTLIDDGNYKWRIKFFTSGTLTFSSLGNGSSIDVFLVGGGGGGAGGGGAGGITSTVQSVSPSAGTAYAIVIGSGAAGKRADTTVDANATKGGTTSAFGHSALGGGSGVGGGKGADTAAGSGGSGGGGFGAGTGGSDGGNGARGKATNGTGWAGGSGQGTTTREFGEANGNLYAGGGAGGNYFNWTYYETVAGGDGGGGGSTWLKAGSSGAVNTGGGGGGGYYDTSDSGNAKYTGGAGGSGIVVIRNHQ